MRVMSLLAPAEFASLRAKVPGSWIVRQVSFRGALKELAGGPAGVIVVSPAELATDALQAIVAASQEGGGRVVLYNTDNLLGAEELVSLVLSAHVEIVAPMADGSIVSVTSAIATSERSAPCQLLRRVAARLLSLPAPCVSPAVRLFTLAPIPCSATAFFAEVGRNQTTVGRWLREASLCAPRELLTIARVASVCGSMRASESQMPGIARRAGFRRLPAMRRACERFLETSWADLRRVRLQTRVAVDRLQEHLLRG